MKRKDFDGRGGGGSSAGAEQWGRFRWAAGKTAEVWDRLGVAVGNGKKKRMSGRIFSWMLWKVMKTHIKYKISVLYGAGKLRVGLQ